MINTDVLSTLTKYCQLSAVRQSDGKKVVATRTIPRNTPVRWEITEVAKQPVDSSKLSFFRAPVRIYVSAYRTSELVQFTIQGVYSEWQPARGSVADTVDYVVD